MKKEARQYGRPDVLSEQDIRGSPVPEDLAPFFPEARSVFLSGVFPEILFNGESYVLEDIGYVTRRKGKLDFPGGTRRRPIGPRPAELLRMIPNRWSPDFRDISSVFVAASHIRHRFLRFSC